MEWALDRHGALWLLQSRPITTVALPSQRRGPVWGPAPVAETFPAPLRRLEDDLWVAPLAEGLDRALRITGAAPAVPVTQARSGSRGAHGGRLGGRRPHPSGRAILAEALVSSRLDPRPPLWRLRVAWHVGRLRLAIGAIGRDVVLAADTALGEVPDPRELDDRELIGTLLSARASLVSLNAHEALAGMLIGADAATSPATSGVVAAHRALAAGRHAGWTDAEIIAREPSVLAPAPRHYPAPRRAAGRRHRAGRPHARSGPGRHRSWRRPRSPAPAHPLDPSVHGPPRPRGRAPPHRARRPDPSRAGRRPRPLGAARRPPHPVAVPARGCARLEGLPPPDRFRFTTDGAVAALPARTNGVEPGGGLGAGGGRGSGEVWDLAGGPPPAGAVVVTRFLDPGLAAHLPGLAGLVAETGSVLSHLAIVARELGIPTVVGAAGAVERFPAGTALLVDGHTGEVRARPSPTGAQ